MPSPTDTADFDYVIVGAGSAGCVLAARLTEDPDVRVLLLEAGPANRSWAIDMPSGMGRLLSSERFNWAYVSEPEPFLDNRRLVHPRGRVIGGSSSINGMMYVRGHARDYDSWAQQGLSGWSYAELLPYFKRAEAHEKGGDGYHGGEGPLAVSSPRIERSPLAQAFIQAGIPKQAIAIYPGMGDVGAAVLAHCPRSLIFGGTATVEQYKGNPRVQAHGPGFSKILLERRAGISGAGLRPREPLHRNGCTDIRGQD